MGPIPIAYMEYRACFCYCNFFPRVCIFDKICFQLAKRELTCNFFSLFLYVQLRAWNTDFIIVCQNLIGLYTWIKSQFWHLYGLLFFLETIGVCLRKSHFNFGGKFELRSYSCMNRYSNQCEKTTFSCVFVLFTLNMKLFYAAREMGNGLEQKNGANYMSPSFSLSSHELLWNNKHTKNQASILIRVSKVVADHDSLPTQWRYM